MNDTQITLAEFFEKVAPGKWATVSGIATMESNVAARLPAPPTVHNRSSQLPQIRLHCAGECAYLLFSYRRKASLKQG